MCPECKVALDWEWDDDARDQGDGKCPKCGAPWFLHGFNHPDWGYHAPDLDAIREVVRTITRDDDQCGWTVSYGLLKQIAQATNQSMEDVEAVLLELDAREYVCIEPAPDTRLDAALKGGE